MNKFAALLYRLSGAVPQYLAECPASERQRYRNMGYAMAIVGVITAFSAHHAALLCGVNDPLAWVPASLWGLFMIACDRICVMALAHREDRAPSPFPIIVRTMLVLVNALVLGFFALLAYNQEGSARIRLVQKQQALAHDQTFLEGRYQTGARAAEVAESANSLKDLSARLALVPPPIANLRDKATGCERDLGVLKASNGPIRISLRADLTDLQSGLSAPETGLAGEIGTAPPVKADAERIRARLAALDQQEAQMRKECSDLKRQAELASRAYYGPLSKEKAQNEELLAARNHDLAEAKTKVDSGMAESEKVSAAAYGFNLSGETGALWELLTRSAFSIAIGLIILLISVCLETLPILQKIRTRGGPYDQRVAAEEQAFEATTRHHYNLEILESTAAAEKVRTLMPDVMEISKPLTMFVLSEGEIGKARMVMERSVNADPSCMEHSEDAFYTAVRKARRIMRAFLSEPAADHHAGGGGAPDTGRAGPSWAGSSRSAATGMRQAMP